MSTFDGIISWMTFSVVVVVLIQAGPVIEVISASAETHSHVLYQGCISVILDITTLLRS